MKLAAGEPTPLSFTGLKDPPSVAVDGSGDVYVVDLGPIRW